MLITSAMTFALSAAAAMACPVADDLRTNGGRFLGPDGVDEVHKRLDADRVQIDLYEPGVPGSYRSIMIRGVYLQWLGSVEGNGRITPDSVFPVNRAEPPNAPPLPTAGYSWSGTQQFVDVVAGNLDDETVTIVAGPQQLGFSAPAATRCIR